MVKQRWTRPFSLALGALLFAGAFHAARAHVRITTDLTWSEHIRPIFENKCMSCHSPAGVAPDYIDLTTYGNKPGQSGARDWAKAIEEEILTGRMPPWKADSRFGRFENHRFLTSEEEQYIIAWIRGGAPQGPERDLPTPERFAERNWNFGQPDYIVEMPEPHQVDENADEDILSVLIPVDLDENQWITGFEFFPGTPTIVHTIEALIHDPVGSEPEVLDVEISLPYDPLADPDDLELITQRATPPGPHFLGQWTRGDNPVLLPDEAGRRLRKGSSIELRVNYRKQGWDDQGKAFTDQSRLGLFFAREPVDLIVEATKIENPDFTIPAGESAHTIVATTTIEEDSRILALYPQMNHLGRSMRLRATYPDGEQTTLLFVPDYHQKWSSSFILDRPVPAPKGTVIELIGTYDNSTGNWDNPNRPPLDVRAGVAPGHERLTAWIDTSLDAHLYVPTPVPTPRPDDTELRGGMIALSFGPDELLDAEPQVGAIFGQLIDRDLIAESEVETQGEPEPDAKTAAAQEPLSPVVAPSDQVFDPDGVYWCPMRGTAEGLCGLHDYHEPGRCHVCGMSLRPRAWFLKRFEGRLAKTQGDWQLNRSGVEEVYWCVNRGSEDHERIDYPRPGTCPVDGLPLFHQSRFDPVRTYICLTPGCPDEERVYYSAGLCPSCQQPVQSMGHMDHTPVYGGQLIMADNLYHHLEGTLPSPDTFRMYFYNDWKELIDPRNFAGKVVIERWDDDLEDIVVAEFEMAHLNEEDPYLTAHITPVEDFPVNFDTLVWLAGSETLFSFAFDGLSVIPDADAPAPILRLHLHGEREPVIIPETPEATAREIYARNRIVRDLIAEQDWLAIHNPAFDAMDFANAMKDMEEGLGPRERARLREAIDRITQGAILLDRAGDAEDEPRTRRAYEAFVQGVQLLQEIFPEN